MRRLYEGAAYATPGDCAWRHDIDPPAAPRLETDIAADVAIVGAGYTGLNCALALAEAGLDTVLLDAEHPGWGASGRNGGFCCAGGAKAPDSLLRRRFGAAGLLDWRATGRAAIDHVAGLIDRFAMQVDRHSAGETVLAHTPRAFDRLRAACADTRDQHGVAPVLHPPGDLPALGLGGRFFGGATLPLGFALHPGKYLAGLHRATETAGARLFGQSPVTAITRDGPAWRLVTPRGTVKAGKVVIATNGYSSEDIPPWLRARTLPVQSRIILTRPLSPREQARQGWTSAQMCYDTRILLHYFRLLPDGRFLFGMRGGLRATAGAERALSRRIRAHFHHLFPEWRDIEIAHEWSGLVCLMRNLTPYAGPVPDMPGVFAGLGYHGNGVAMGSYAGARLADLVRGRRPDGPWPAALRAVPGRFPLGRFRRALLVPAYAAATLLDR